MEHFIKAYPRPLVCHVVTICEPPQVTYNDFTLGDWPESVVASYMKASGKPTDPPPYNEPDQHFRIAGP
jgi:hypothetical protein